MRTIETAAPMTADGARAGRAVKVGSCLVIAVVLELACRASSAGSATASLSVSATVQSACVASAQSLAIAAYTAGGGPVTGSTAITVKCSPGLGFKVALSPGATPGGSISEATLLTMFAEVPDSAVNRFATPGIYTDLVTVIVTY